MFRIKYPVIAKADYVSVRINWSMEQTTVIIPLDIDTKLIPNSFFATLLDTEYLDSNSLCGAVNLEERLPLGGFSYMSGFRNNNARKLVLQIRKYCHCPFTVKQGDHVATVLLTDYKPEKTERGA